MVSRIWNKEYNDQIYQINCFDIAVESRTLSDIEKKIGSDHIYRLKEIDNLKNMNLKQKLKDLA